MIEENGEEGTPGTVNQKAAASGEAAAAAATPIRSTRALDGAPVDWDGPMSLAGQSTPGFFMYSNAGPGSIFAQHGKRVPIKHPKRAEGE